jgi:hypothetical protein
MNAIQLIAELTPQARNQVLIALAIMMVLVMIGGCGILLFRRRLRQAVDADASGNVGFSLSDLREMRDRGEITSEEYEATRMKVIASVRNSLAVKPPRKGSSPLPPPRPPTPPPEGGNSSGGSGVR